MSDGLIEIDDAPRKRGRPPTPQLCGTCRNIRFTDSQALTLAAGTCYQSTASGRFGVQAAAEGCPLWERRSPERKRSDQRQQERVRMEVAALNGATRHRKRR